MLRIDKQNRTFEVFKKLVPHLRGALWWVRNDLLKERQRAFNQNDNHIGHPALSIRSCPLENCYEPVPMLIGTSGNSFSAKRKSRCVKVVNLTKDEPEHPAYFGSIVEPGMYSIENLLDGVVAKNNVEVAPRAKVGDPAALRMRAWHNDRVMYPNWHKSMLDDEELIDLNDFCIKHYLEER